MKDVLCFGDSNTWGFVPGRGVRYDEHTRWTGDLQDALGLPGVCMRTVSTAAQAALTML